MVAVHVFAQNVSIVFGLLTCIFSFHLVYKHLTNYNQPKIQRYIIRLLWMVPIYSFDAYISLAHVKWKIYVDAFRDCYEAYVLYQFFSLLVAYLNGSDALEDLFEHKPPLIHPFPLCWLPPLRLGKSFFVWSNRYILQFVLLKPFLAFATLFLEVQELYDEGNVRIDRGFMYIAAISNISISFSLYYLVLFYKATEENLRPFNPLPKFLCIKSIIFFSFWQGLGVVALVRLGIIQDSRAFSAEELGILLQNTLISVEMFLLSITHRYVFDYQSFLRRPSSPLPSTTSDVSSTNTREEHRAGSVSSPVSLSPSIVVGRSSSTGVTPALSGGSFVKNLQDVADLTDVIDDTLDALKPVKDRHPKMP